MPPIQVFSLRAHAASVTASDSYHSGTSTTYVSADSDGWIVWWDLGLKRPIQKWKGHDGNVLTVNVIDSNRVLTQGRDSSVNIWHLDASTTEMVPNIEVPINSLNFCNVDFIEPYLFTPATVDSNNFDLYVLQRQSTGEYEFSRIIANFNPHELYTKQSPVVEIPSSDPELARSGFGIIMKLVYVPESRNLFLGYESGDILGLHIDFEDSKSLVSSKSNDRTVINKDPKVSFLYHNSSHTPNPIISLIHKEDRLFSGSTNKKIISHNYATNAQETYKLSNPGIQCIYPYQEGLVVGHWNGLIEGIVLDSNFQNAFFKIKRDVPRVGLTLSNTTTVNETSKDLKTSIKLTTLNVISPSDTENFPESGTKKSYKDLVKAKRNNKVLGGPLLMVGYEDGAITAFK